MYVKEISALTDFMATSTRSGDDLCKFLALNILRAFLAKAIFVGEVNSSGSLRHVSSFGFEPHEIESWSKLSLDLDIPVTEAVLTNRCVIVESPKTLFETYPDLLKIGFSDDNFKSCIAVPVLPYGVYVLLLHGKPKRDVEFELFLRSIGNLITLNLRRDSRPVAQKPDWVPTQSELTSRQKLVKDLLAKGYTNGQIANEIGYSESLVRQETIAIYACLKVSGRKELIRLVDENPTLKA